MAVKVMMDRKITTRPIVSTRHAWVILCPCQEVVERCLIIFFLKSSYALALMWVCNEFKPYPPYLLLVIACNACACCVICGNCLAVDWHNALAACGLQRKAPVVSQLFRAENWWKERVASWAQKERMNFWADSIGHFCCGEVEQHTTILLAFPHIGLFGSCVESDWK